MQLSCFNAPAEWSTEYDRRVVAAAGTVTHAGCLNHDLIERFKDKTYELDFRNRAESLDTQTYCHTANSGFCKRRIEYALFAELFLQAFRSTEYATDITDVFPEDQNVRVTF